MKKIVAVLLSLVMMMSVFTVASAENISQVSYYVEYNEDGTATVIFQAGKLYAFDFGIIYEPDKLTVDEYDYSEEYYALATDSNYTSVHVKNDKAVDNVGNSTYVVFTGAIMGAEDGDYIGFAERNLAKVTFSGIDEGDEIVVVMGTAKVEDVKNAQVVGAVDLYKQVEIGTSQLLDGAIGEPDKGSSTDDSSANGGSDNTWLYGVIFGIIIVAAVILVIVSKKSKLDVNVKEIVEDDEDEEDDDE